MSRQKSPSYPNYSLRKALKYAEAIFTADRRNPIDREVVAKHMGYTSLSGAADKSLSTMMQYGLLEKTGKGEVRVAQTAVDILHPDREQDRKAALVRAAFTPTLFKTLKARFTDDKFSDDALRSFLMREGFLERAISPVLTAYSETIAFLAQEKASESGGAILSPEEESTDEDDNEREFGGAAVGDLVQWEVGGVLKLPKPHRVRAVSEDEEWVFVEGSETGIPMDEVFVEQKATTGQPAAKTPPTLALTKDEPLRPGTRKEVFALDEGDVTITFPDDLTEDSFSDLEAYIEVFLTKAARRAGITRTKATPSAMEHPEVSYRRGFTHGAWNAWQAAQRDLTPAVMASWIDNDLADWWHQAFERAKEGHRVFSGRPPMPDGMMFEKPKSDD